MSLLGVGVHVRMHMHTVAVVSLTVVSEFHAVSLHDCSCPCSSCC
jgi:hypothetical protein